MICLYCLQVLSSNPKRIVKNINREYAFILQKHKYISMASSTICNNPLFRRALVNENNAVITTLTTRKITAGKLGQLHQLGLAASVLQDYMTKLKDYRYVDDLNGLTHGAYIRWIDLKNPEALTLARGGIVCDIKIGQKGVSLLCKTYPNPALFHINMDECLIFQRLSQQERILLVALDYLDVDDASSASDEQEEEEEEEEVEEEA